MLANLSRKQTYIITAGILLLTVIAVGVFGYLAGQKKGIVKEKTLEEQNREEFENLRKETDSFQPTKDSEEQLKQLEMLRKQRQLGVELGEEEAPPPAEEQQAELQKLREQNK